MLGGPLDLPHIGARARRRYALAAPTLVDAFDADSGYTLVGANASKALDTTHKVQGAGCMAVTGHNINQTCGLDKTYATTADPASPKVLAVYFNRISDASVSQVALSVSTNGGSLSNVNFVNEASFRKGGRWLAADLSEFTLATQAGALRVRELISQASPFSCQGAIDALYYNAAGRPTIVFVFDDINETMFDNIPQLFAARGLKASFAVPKNLVGQSGRMTQAECLTLYNDYGWDALSNPTDDVSLTGLGSTQAAVDDMLAARSFLSGLGMTRAMNHMVWSNGAWNDAIATALEAEGFLTARTTEPQSFHDRFGLGAGIRMNIPSQGFSSNITIATARARVTEAKLRGTTQFFHLHGFTDTTDFVTFLDEVKADRDANLLDVLTVSQWHSRTSVGATPS